MEINPRWIEFITIQLMLQISYGAFGRRFEFLFPGIGFFGDVISKNNFLRHVFFRAFSKQIKFLRTFYTFSKVPLVEGDRGQWSGGEQQWSGGEQQWSSGEQQWSGGGGSLTMVQWRRVVAGGVGCGLAETGGGPIAVEGNRQ